MESAIQDHALTLIDLPCDCCGEHNERLILNKKGALTKESFRLVKCLNCGFLYINPRPTEASIKSLYDDDYYIGKGFDPFVDYVGDFAKTDDISKAFKPGAHAERLSTFKPAPARLLDFGCGLGDFARQAKLKGYEVEGFEISPAAREFCSKHGLKTYSDMAQIPDEYYDIVTAIEVLEHAYSPTEILKNIYRILKKDGVFLYTTYNLQLFEIMHRLGVAKDHSYICPEGHLNFFNRKTIMKYFNKIGFSKIGQPFFLADETPVQLVKMGIKRVLGLHLPCAIK